MAPKIMFGNTIQDWQEKINVARMREERAERARQMMRNHGIPVLLAGSNDNIRYLTGLKGSKFAPQLRYVLFFAEGDPVVFEHAGYFHQMPDQAPWIKQWRIARCALGGIAGVEATREEAELFASEIYEEIRGRGLTLEQIGIVGVDAISKEALEKLKLRCVGGGPIMSEARVIKTQDEVNCLKMVATIVEGAWYKIWENLRPGIRANQLNGILAQALADGGADGNITPAWKSGPATFERGPANEDKILETGDLLYVNLCHVQYLGYNSCSYRTFIVGRKPNDKEKDWYKTLLERVNSVIEAVRPGATTADAAKHFAPATKWGFKSELEVLSIELGHGLGLGDGYDPPVINRLWSFKHPQVFEANMVMAIESLEGERRLGGVRLENMFHVTPNGSEIIDHMVRDQILVAPLGWQYT